MTDSERPDQEPKSTETGIPPPAVKGRQSFARIRRELSEEELKSPAVQRLLVEEIERLERENTKLVEYRDDYFEADKQVGILQERAKASLASEIMYGACMTVGAAAVGIAPVVWSIQPAGIIAIIFGAVLIVGGIASRVVRR